MSTTMGLANLTFRRCIQPILHAPPAAFTVARLVRRMGERLHTYNECFLAAV